MTATGRIEIDDACCGHARCYEIAPALFDLDEEGRAVILRQPATASELDEVQRAAMACPEQAIRIVQAD
jgi:ferredoxin